MFKEIMNEVFWNFVEFCDCQRMIHGNWYVSIARNDILESLIVIRLRSMVNFELLVFYKSARMIIVYYFEVYISWILFCYSEKKKV